MKSGLVVFLVFILIPFTGYADFSSSTNFIIERGVVDTGGGNATSSGFNLRTSIGQAGTGISSSTSFTIRGGFLNFFVAATSVTPTTTQVVVSSPGVGGGGTGFFLSPTKGKQPVPEAVMERIDFNRDASISIIDLSILLFYYGRGDSEIKPYDLNSDGKIDIADISILMFYWTG